MTCALTLSAGTAVFVERAKLRTATLTRRHDATELSAKTVTPKGT